jgi:hypothetical protein
MGVVLGGRAARPAFIAALLAVAIVYALATTRADSYQRYFCPQASSFSYVYIPKFSSCVGPRVGDLKRVYSEYKGNGGSVQHCAVGKQYSDGGGANLIPAQCGKGKYQVTVCAGPIQAWPKIKNDDNNNHNFHGDYDYASCHH